MQLTIDKAGRIVLPKAIRDDFNLGPGAVLDVEETGDSIVLRPKHDQPVVREKLGLLVVSASATADLSRAVEDSRNGRLDQLAGDVAKRGA